MKPVMQHISLSLFTSLLLLGCGGSSDEPNVSDDEQGIRMLEKNSNLSGVINPVSDVDWYTIEMREPGIVALKLYNETMRYDVDVLATVYEEDANGDLQRLAADHFTEDSASSSSLNINVNVTAAKTLYVAVRDLDDNDASDSESYTISYDVAAPEDNNGTFDTAVTLLPDGTCHTDSIGTVGDIDVMQFTLSNSGVFEIATDFSAFAGGTGVELKMSLFDNEGTLIRSVNQTVEGVYRLVESLAAGSYYILVHDQGKDSFDTASPFTTCLASVGAAEVSGDDTQETATVVSGSGHFEIAGSLDYAGDEDWNSIQSGATPPSIQVLQIEFDPSAANGCDSWYLMEVTDANDLVLFSKEYSTETGPRTAHIKVESSGEHFISVSAIDEHVCSLDDTIGMPYQATVDVVNVSDDAEMGDGNNTINDAIELDETSNTATEAMMSYVGDVDWYRITVPADHDQDQILEIYIDSESATPLEYYVNIFHTDQILDTFTARESDTNPVSFKASYLIPSSPDNTNADYFVKVVDMQSDEADIDTLYTIRSNIVPVQTQAPATGDTHVAGASYFGETVEQTLFMTDSNIIELVINGNERKQFSYNASAFALAPEQVASLVSTDEQAGTIRVSFPWQSGYIDYHEDRDWYQIDLSSIYAAAGGTDSTWYAEIRVELYSPAPGSTVEYAWGLYSDQSDNKVVNDWQGGDGFFATNGDTSAAVEAVNLVTPAADASGPMWRNHETAAVPYYITVTDIINQSNVAADNDWGYDQAYYLRTELIYHPGSDRPAN